MLLNKWLRMTCVGICAALIPAFADAAPAKEKPATAHTSASVHKTAKSKKAGKQSTKRSKKHGAKKLSTKSSKKKKLSTGKSSKSKSTKQTKSAAAKAK